MASTNKTSNYELSQFLGTDKPAWLSDYNSDMGKIDAQMKLNADAATTASGDAASAVAAVGTLSNLTTDAKTSAVAAINEVDGHADTAQSTASSALSAATTANNDLTALKAYLAMSSVTNYDGTNMSVTAGGSSISGTPSITVARNAAGTLCKIYGQIAFTGATQGSNTVIKLNADTGLKPSERLTITNCGIAEIGGNIGNVTIFINTDGTIEFQGYNFYASGTEAFRLFAVLIFVEDFGDTPQ